MKKGFNQKVKIIWRTIPRPTLILKHFLFLMRRKRQFCLVVSCTLKEDIVYGFQIEIGKILFTIIYFVHHCLVKFSLINIA